MNMSQDCNLCENDKSHNKQYFGVHRNGGGGGGGGRKAECFT